MLCKPRRWIHRQRVRSKFKCKGHNYRPRTKYEGRLCFDTSLCVCPQLWGGKGYPIPGLGGYPILGLGGSTPSQVWVRGTPSQVWMVGGSTPSQVWMVWGVPHPRSGWGGTPSQVWVGWGVPHPRSGWWGVPHPRS